MSARSHRLAVAALCVAGLLAVTGCGGAEAPAEREAAPPTQTAPPTATQQPPAEQPGPTSKPEVQVPEGSPPEELKTKDLVKGDGRTAQEGDMVTVQYVGVLYKTGEEFDASYNRGEPFTFTLGAGEVIPGWDEGIAGMKVGGRRRLVIPPDQAYGDAGSPPVIGPGETLVFVVDLVSVE
ncbi:MAG TPA: FKBP-type peptidyl-prolyl cis-trans isomerase [Solirubrobacteraceae bacterium]|nr:FKBP-type peptidyl-prolyl cis-trans isomerase [Solirubrobacteraceae bacterium]